MGTRNLTVVYIDGEYKVAQYGQWDGYPKGQGITALSFLRDKMDLAKFKTALRNSTYISTEKLTALWKQYGADDNGFVSLKGAEAMKLDFPEYSRDTGAKILELIQNCPCGIELNNEIRFAADGLFCEWAWVVDLDTRTFEAYKGYHKEPLTEKDRFYFLRQYESEGHPGVRLVEKWNLDALPTDEEFLATFKKDGFA